MSGLYEITPFTLLDYPGEMACVVWFAGCNMRCQYCHNPAIVTGQGQREEDELLSFLQTRIGKLKGVVFSGGEATLYPELLPLIRKVKDLGFKIKLDTNGSRPQVLRALLDEKLLDYVAMDYKCPEEKTKTLIGTSKLWAPFRESLVMMISAAEEGVAFEVRTTIHPDLMSEDEVATMIHDLDDLGYKGTYYLQLLASFGEKTIGFVPEPVRRFDREILPEPRGFKLGYRNFKD